MFKSICGEIKNHKGVYFKYLFCVFFLAAVITSCFFSFFTEIISQKLYPDRDIEIKILFEEKSGDDQRAVIHSHVSNLELWETMCNSEIIGNWAYQYNDESSERLIAGNIDDYCAVRFTRTHYIHEYVDITCAGGKGVAEITINGNTQKYELSSDDNIISLYDDKTDARVTIINCIVFAFAMTSIAALLMLLFWVFLSGRLEKGLPGKEYGIWSFVTLTVLFFIWSIVAFNYGIEEYSSGYGDQGFYWSEGNSINPFIAAKNLVLPHRGYLCTWISSICIRLGNFFGFAGEIIWILFLCILHGFFFGYAFPRIYEILSEGKKVKAYQIAGMAVIYTVGPFGYLLTGKLGDAPGYLFFFLAVWAILESREKGLRYCFMSGLFIAISISHRMTYKHALYSGLFCVFVYWIVKAIKTKHFLSLYHIKIVIMFVLGILVISLPQIYGNLSKGVFSIFPYTFEGTNQAISTASWGLQAGTLVFGYPYGATDPSFIKMAGREGLVNYGDGYSLMTVLSVLSSQWLDTVVYIFKKLFFGFSPIRDISYGSIITGYPNSFPYVHATKFAIISMFYYLLCGCSVYLLLIKNKLFALKEKILFSLIFFTLLLPQTFVHVEHRYFLPGYMIIYYIVCYTLMPLGSNYKDDSNWSGKIEKASKMIMFVSLYVIASESLLGCFY